MITLSTQRKQNTFDQSSTTNISWHVHSIVRPGKDNSHTAGSVRCANERARDSLALVFVAFDAHVTELSTDQLTVVKGHFIKKISSCCIEAESESWKLLTKGSATRRRTSTVTEILSDYWRKIRVPWSEIETRPRGEGKEKGESGSRTYAAAPGQPDGQDVSCPYYLPVLSP